jgi:hypothetical protein
VCAGGPGTGLNSVLVLFYVIFSIEIRYFLQKHGTADGVPEADLNLWELSPRGGEWIS